MIAGHICGGDRTFFHNADQLHLATISSPLGELAARSSRLWMNQKPMLVAELFLPPSPIYRKE